MKRKNYFLAFALIAFLGFAVFASANSNVSNPESASTFMSTGSLTSGSVIFTDGTQFAENNSNLFWDNVNNFLGIGTTTP